MHVVLRRIETLGGLGVASDEDHDIDRVTLGRGTDQTVELPDMRVTLAHAEIRLQPGGGYRIECQGDNPVWINGSPETESVLGVGDTIDVGRFRITVGAPEPGVDLLLEIEERSSVREEKGRHRRAYRMNLEQGGLRKRRWAWGLAVLLLLLALVLPAVMRFAGSGGGRSLDAVLQAGPPSAAHAAFIGDCSRCHQAPFAPVRNDACLGCHKAQPHHSDRPEILALEGMEGARCAACHEEHNGRQALIARSTQLCTRCHADPAAHYSIAELPPVHSFDGDHPQFTLNLALLKEGKPLRRETPQAEGAALHEDPGLIFGHDVHLAAKGINSPQGTVVMHCADCHVPAGNGFAPVRMADHCVSCHQLELDPEHPGRRLPHGPPEEVVATIRDHYARQALAGGVTEASAPEVVRLIRRPGEVLTPAQSQAALAWADAQADRTLEDVLGKRVCAECHIVTQAAPRTWSVAPVSLTANYLAGARFDHRAHGAESCDRCHQAQDSKLSSEVMIPGIANCRDCHSDSAGSGRTATACVDCHGFHIGKTATFAPAATAPPP